MISKFPFNGTEDAFATATKLVEAMREKKSYYLTAPQIGIHYPIIAIEGEPAQVLFNPRVIEYGEKKSFKLESCADYPGLQIKISRPEIVSVRFTTADEYTTTKNFVGLTSRIVQHALSHLELRTFFEDANYLNRERAHKQWKLLQRRKST